MTEESVGAIDHWVNSIHQGNCRNVLGEIPDESAHAIVTDPPYGLAFMERSWDDFEPKEYQQWCENWARQAKDVLKPGGHLLAFSGNRTHHRLFSGVEDAGFTVRDTITWHYGSGFPKNTSTQLKPATEFVVLARKPLDGTVAENVLEHGTGALNIDGCRISIEDEEAYEDNAAGRLERHSEDRDKNVYGEYEKLGREQTTVNEGRYPANVIFDEFAVERLDNEGGDVDGCQPHTISDSGKRDVLDDGGLSSTGDRVEGYADSGGPSRFFYTSKATRAERTLDGQIDNSHPTVKPQDLMEWLVRLVTAEDQIVLDPFVGTGTTCKAAKELGRRFIGIENQAKWADVARVRCGLEPEDPSHVRRVVELSGLEVFADGG